MSSNPGTLHILYGHFFTYISVIKICGVFEKTKINEKEVGPFFKKLAESCCLVKYLLLLLNDLVALNARQAEMNPLAAVLGHGD